METYSRMLLRASQMVSRTGDKAHAFSNSTAAFDAPIFWAAPSEGILFLCLGARFYLTPADLAILRCVPHTLFEQTIITSVLRLVS
jgi:hypothetical protein